MEEFVEIIETQGPKKIRKRKKVADPDSWAKNVRKRMRNTGRGYISVRGTVRRDRQVQPKDCSQCRKNCNKSFPEEERQKIHESFWALGDAEKRRIYVSTLVEEEPVHRRRNMGAVSRRSNTRIYYLRCGRLKVPVCKQFFLATLDISEGVIHNILKNRDETSWFPRESRQGKTPRTNMRPEEAKQVIREHIRSFIDPDQDKPKRPGCIPVQEVVGGMSVKKMYQAYVSDCMLNETQPEKEWLYRRICTTEFNLKFLSDTQQGDEMIQEVVEEVEGEEGVVDQVFIMDHPEQQEVEHEEVTTTMHDGDHIYYHEGYFYVKKEGEEEQVEEEVEVEVEEEEEEEV